MGKFTNQHRIFDKEKVKESFLSILPDTHPARNKKNTITTITTFWKKGRLTRVEINGIDWTNYINKVDEKINSILKMSGRYKNNYTGTVTLTGIKKEGEFERLKYNSGNAIF